AELAASVRSSHDSRKGIESVLEAEREIGLDESALKALDCAEKFFSTSVEKLLFLHGYLFDPALDRLPDPFGSEVLILRESLRDLGDLVLEGEMPALEERFE